MRVGLVIDRALRMIDGPGNERRDRVVGLIRELAVEYHNTGSMRDHADPNITTTWIVGGIETCEDPLCVEALMTIKDIRNIGVLFPLRD